MESDDARALKILVQLIMRGHGKTHDEATAIARSIMGLDRPTWPPRWLDWS